MAYVIQPPPQKMPLPANAFAILTIENDCVRIVDNNLENYLKPISDFPNIELNHYPNDLFDEYNYFWDRLHNGNDINSLTYADIYMTYLFYHLKIDVVNILYQNYLKNLQGELGLICYWQKEWLKFIFKVKFAKELRQFDKEKWVNTITTHLATFKSQTPPNTH